MLFNSFEFVIFFPIVVALFFVLPHRFRWILLLSASYYFYMCWKAEYVILIAASTLIDYLAGLRMDALRDRPGRKKYLILSIVANLGMLFAFKYFNFFSEAFRDLLGSFNIMQDAIFFDVLLPVGISFYTFQTLSYTIDIYRGKRRAERHLGYFAVYVSFFPQLVAGPIERSTRLLPQFFEEKKFDSRRVSEGLRLMLFGFFKKIVIADRLAAYVDNVYSDPTAFGSATIIIATYFFAFQIYCDFSGYSDIAIGAARVMGYDLMDNFRRPYMAKSISEFWKRWHISLSTWFRDYLYIPLGGNRRGNLRLYTNLLVVFVVSGFWHGANWTFLIWGGLHGTYLLISLWTESLKNKLWAVTGLRPNGRLRNAVRMIVTFHLVLFAWIFFRAGSLADAGTVISRIAAFDFSNLVDSMTAGFALPNYQAGWFQFFVAIAAIVVMELIQRRTTTFADITMSTRPAWRRWSLDYALMIAIAILGVFEHSEFIYFQF